MDRAGFAKEELMVNGVRTCVYSAGSGKPLFYLHGAGIGDFSFMLKFADRYRVLIPHHPGFGESADDPEISDIHDYVMHYLELWDILGLDRADVIGHSLGGWIAARFACEHSHRLEKLVLVAPAGLRVEGCATADLFMLTQPELASRLVANPDALPPLYQGEMTPEIRVQQYRQQTTLARFAWVWPWDRKLPRWLGRIRVPTLLLWGREDRLAPVEQVEYWSRSIPRCETAVLDNCGHLVFNEQPSASIAAIDRFLAGAAAD